MKFIKIIFLVAAWGLIACGNNRIDTYSISGKVTSNGTPLPGVTISLDSAATTTTDVNGNYAFSDLPTRTYVITPSKSGYFFYPISSTQTLASANIGDVNFIASIDLAPFVNMANSAACANILNQLFLIDNHLVFWYRQGRCPDNSFGQKLFSDTVDTVLCYLHDSVAGPTGGCSPNDSYSTMFDTIISNLDKPDLGLGTYHTVEEIIF
jgi:Carboxypeptidase regulatory-like domain